MHAFTKTFTFRLACFTIALACLTFGLSFILPGQYFTPALPYLFVFFFIVSFTVFFFLTQGKENKFSHYVNRFMLTTFLKLMVYMAVMVIYVLSYRNDAIRFILTFFILYLAFTFFDVLALLQHSRKSIK
jgi:hypothetical protein